MIILLIVAGAFVFSLVCLIREVKFKHGSFGFTALVCSFFFALLFVGLITSAMNEYQRRWTVIEEKEAERKEIEERYRDSLESHDKHVKTSATAAVIAWNQYVCNYRNNCDSLWFGVFYFDDVAKALRYIDIDLQEDTYGN